MMTRQQYMDNSKDLHNIYWAQFVTPGVKSWVTIAIGIKALKASQDPHFNDIALENWDRFYNSPEFSGPISRALRDSGDVNARSISNACCVAKHAAYELIDALSNRRRSIKIYLHDGNTIETEINGTRKTILEYYGMGKYEKGVNLNIGDGSDGDKFSRVQRIEFLA